MKSEIRFNKNDDNVKIILTKENEIKKAAKRWIDNSTIHGFPKIFNKDLPFLVRLLWLMLVACFLVLCVFSIYEQCTVYFSFSAVTSTTMMRDTVTIFPTVTFCNYNFYNTPEGTKYATETLEGFNKLPPTNFSFPRSKIKLIQNRLAYLKSSLLKNKSVYDNATLKKSFGLTLEEMMISCYFGNRPCNQTEFEYFFDINYGNCYRFNSGYDSLNQSVKLSKVITPGDTSGLQLGIYVGAQNESMKLSYSTGIYMSIHNHTFRGLIPTNGFNIPTGRATIIGLKRKFFEKLDFPYSDCIKNKKLPDAYHSKLFKKTIELAGIYSKLYCYKLCIQKHIIANCTCFDVDYPVYNLNVSACLEIDYKCNDEFLYKSDENDDFKKDCEIECPFECDRIEFDYTMSGNDYPSFSYGYEIMPLLNITQFENFLALQKSIMRISVYYDTLLYEYISEAATVSLLNFLLNIGYTFGLFFGMSCISLCELFELTVYIITYFVEKYYIIKECNKIKSNYSD